MLPLKISMLKSAQALANRSLLIHHPQIMTYCSSRQLKLVCLTYEVYTGRSTIQSFDAVLRNEGLAKHASWSVRATLAFVLILPLSLSASYKLFSGGSSTITIQDLHTTIGLTGSIGSQRIGNGISLMAETYVPFWVNAHLNTTYGYNMYVESNTTTALLDAPLPDSLTGLMASMGLGESLVLTADVNATVAELIPIPASQRNSVDYWNQVYVDYSQSSNSSQAPDFVNDELGGAFSGMLAGKGTLTPLLNWDFSEIYLSWWNTTQKETFASTAELFQMTRRHCTGTWNITSTTASLISATILQTSEEAIQSTDQSLMTNNQIGIVQIYQNMLAEYDWRTRQDWNFPLPSSPSQAPYQFTRDVSTTSAFASTMLWSRQVTMNGVERLSGVSLRPTLNHYLKTPSMLSITKTTPTLRRAPLLLLVLCAQPLLIMAATMIKACLYAAPISDGVGMISMLAGLDDGRSAVLRGAALSGELERPVYMDFEVRHDRKGGGKEDGNVHISFFDRRTTPGRVRSGVMYG